MNEMTTQFDNEYQNEGYPQITIADTGWTEEERKAMRERGFDEMDMLRVWLA